MEGGDGEEGERSDEIGRDLGVENITLKATQARLRWYGIFCGWMKEIR